MESVEWTRLWDQGVGSGSETEKKKHLSFLVPPLRTRWWLGKSGSQLQGEPVKARAACLGSVWDKNRDRALEVFSIWDLSRGSVLGQVQKLEAVTCLLVRSPGKRSAVLPGHPPEQILHTCKSSQAGTQVLFSIVTVPAPSSGVWAVLLALSGAGNTENIFSQTAMAGQDWEKKIYLCWNALYAALQRDFFSILLFHILMLYSENTSVSQ